MANTIQQGSEVRNSTTYYYVQYTDGVQTVRISDTSVSAAQAKTNATAWCNARIAELVTSNTWAQNIRDALALAPASTYTQSNNWGGLATMNRYAANGGLYDVDSEDVTGWDLRLTDDQTNIAAQDAVYDQYIIDIAALP